MGRYQAYTEYKDSGVDWIGEIPKHWYLTKIRYITDCLDGKRIPLNATERGEMQGEIPYWGANSVVDYVNDWLFDEELVLVGEDGAPFFDKTKSVAFHISGKVWPNNHVHVLRPNATIVNSKFLTYSLNMVDYHLYITGSTRDKLNQSDLNNIVIRYCSVQEQEAIANFLDHETAKIDTLIEQQQQLIQLLKEKRQAVISHAVTKGLNPDAPMKDSGVEWLGEVPAHWKLPKIKWFCKTESGGTPNTGKYEEYYLDGEVPWIRTTDLNNNDLMDTPIKITQKAVNDSACALLPINSVLIAMYGGSGSIGKHSLLKFESTINQAVCAVLPNQKILPEFLHLYVEFYRPYWMVGAEGTRKDPNINQDTIRELVTPCPPKTEQAAIVAVTKKSLSTIDSIIEQSESNIELMQERRTALISAAVTGKIDVRNWQAPQ